MALAGMKPINDVSHLCRDCGENFYGSEIRICPSCLRPRVLRHPELSSLTIAHVDCDAFYASVEKRDDQSLIDKPVIIGGGKRGVVSTCCYIARMHGIRSAMPMYKALEACPDAVVIRPNMEKYKSVGREVRNLMAEFTDIVEPISIDEAYLDFNSQLSNNTPTAALALIHLTNRMEEELGITSSVGLGPNKFLAKLASDLDKPRGFSLIGISEAQNFLAPLPVKKLWGVGPSLTRRLAESGIYKIGQLQRYKEEDLVNRFGSIGRQLAQFAAGKDTRAIKTQSKRKSISAETTFERDSADISKMQSTLRDLCARTSNRLKLADLAGKTVTLKLKTEHFVLLTRTTTCSHHIQKENLIYETALQLLKNELDGNTKYRLIGVGISKLSPISEAGPPRMLIEL